MSIAFLHKAMFSTGANFYSYLPVRYALWWEPLETEARERRRNQAAAKTTRTSLSLAGFTSNNNTAFQKNREEDTSQVVAGAMVSQ
jgi:hypothetical protein